MPKNRPEFQLSAGKLISAIQKEWGKEIGMPESEISEDAISAAHKLLQSNTLEEVKALLSSRTVEQYLGEIWVKKHPAVLPAIKRMRESLGGL